MSMIAGGYDAGVRLLRLLSPALSRGSSKVAEGIRGRRGAHDALRDWGRTHRSPDRPLAWFHAPSVGEGLQARAVLERLQAVRPTLQSVYTFFSPSAVGLARRMPADTAEYFPWDVAGEMEALLSALTPDFLAFTKTEVWPGVTEAAANRGTPVVLTAATLPASAGRLRLPARILLRRTFASLSLVTAVADEDAERFLELGVAKERIQVTGDPGIDSAWQRVREAPAEAPYLAPFRSDPAPTLVAGSTWRPDEGQILPAFARLRERHSTLRAVIAPHEPTSEHLGRLEAMCSELGVRTVRLSEVEEEGKIGPAEAILVDRVGILAHLYTIGSAAYVGGGFHRSGLHSVLEPAAAGVPVLFGPQHANSAAAGELARFHGARVVRSSGELVEVLRSWLEAPELMEETGNRAFEYIEAHRGASSRTALALAPYLPDSSQLSTDGPETA